MREHAPQSTRLAGVVTTTAITLAVGYALANAFTGYIANTLPDPIIYVPLQDETTADRPPLTAANLDTLTDAPLPLVTPLSNFPEWEVERTVIGSTDPVVPRSDPGPSIPRTPPLPKSVRVAPQIIPATPPPYPPTAIRRNSQGDSALAVCLDARGRVSSASLAGSSGDNALDEAALKWVRTLKFTPLTIDGAPQAICGHSVVYEWRLNRR
jgi:protein TonB